MLGEGGGLVGCDSGLGGLSGGPRIDLAFRIAAAAATEGSPSLCDLDGDGKLELISPLASPTLPSSGSSVLVSDASTGAILWEEGSGLQPYGSSACADADGDGDLDVLVNGRIGDVVALRGEDGSELWRLTERNPGVLAPAMPDTGASSVVLSPDGALAATTLVGNRPMATPGRLVLFRPEGQVVAAVDVPDGAESYASPAFLEGSMGALFIAFGSGGETAAGHLYIVRHDPPSSLSLVGEHASTCVDGGFIASPHVADLDADGDQEVVGADYCGEVSVIERDGSELVSFSVGGFITANPVSAQLDGDSELEVVALTSNLNPSLPPPEGGVVSTVVAIDLDGPSERWERELLGGAFASPTIADVDGDGVDDVFVVVRDFVADSSFRVDGGLFILSGDDGSTLLEMPGASSLGTPVADDVDGDGAMDLFVHDQPSLLFEAGSILRFELPAVDYAPGAVFTGFRGHPDLDGAR